MFLNGLTKFKKKKKCFIYTEEPKLQKVIKIYTGNNFHIKMHFKKYFITLFYMKNMLCKLMV